MKVADLGYKSIEHAWALIPHFTKEKRVIEKDIARKSYELAHQDSAITKAVLQKLAQKKV